MSFSKPEVKTPAQKFLKWKGGTGELSYYDKESEKEIPVALPFRFILLDELTTVKGYDDVAKSGIWSNEIRNLKEDTLYVKSKAGDIVSGTYDQIKDKLKANGGKFARSLYVAYQEADGEDGKWSIANINFSGASVGEWFTFRKKSNLNVEGAVLKGSKKEENGSVKFLVPTFETFQFKPSDIDAGKELDGVVQQYLDTYLTQRQDEKWQSQVEAQGLNKPQDVVLDDIDEDKPIDLSEIPF